MNGVGGVQRGGVEAAPSKSPTVTNLRDQLVNLMDRALHLNDKARSCAEVLDGAEPTGPVSTPPTNQMAKLPASALVEQMTDAVSHVNNILNTLEYELTRIQRRL